MVGNISHSVKHLRVPRDISSISFFIQTIWKIHLLLFICSNRLHFADSAQHQSVPVLLEECSSLFGHRSGQDPDFGEMDFRNHRLRAL